MKPLYQIKLIAFSIHLLFSISIFCIALGLITWIWYPGFFADASDVWQALYTMAFVDVGLGPLLMLVLYKPGKPGLKFDLGMIVVFQLSALIWGSWVLYSQRPVLAVFDEGVVYCLGPMHVKANQADLSSFSTSTNLLPLAYLPFAENVEAEYTRQQRIINSPKNLPGVGAYVLGDLFQPVNAKNLPQLLNEELDVQPALDKNPDYQKLWQQLLQRHPQGIEHLAFLTLSCSTKDYLIALDRQSGVISDGVAISFLNTRKKRSSAQHKQTNTP
ncbi:hypothetical protein [Candidatus Venteria ishoeyi]|uniref:Pilus assembly protein n=1 Tax=Candidatus Venteria ishoeyi TaxID=1899563 RepID=A0A1H6F8N0_9GAMM|nr:hypothetical protein [Candidatus Venteria ishoeyi]MDM8547279.1 hypothetical protein [Candidatus Venteria ishoeyi]SEH06472.1 Uncharacterised protein [Candidatus Venteria ishoeyi]